MKNLPIAIAQLLSLVGVGVYLWMWEPHEFTVRPQPAGACFPVHVDVGPISSECDEYCWALGAADDLLAATHRLDKNMDLLVEAVHDWQDRGSPPLRDPE